MIMIIIYLYSLDKYILNTKYQPKKNYDSVFRPDPNTDYTKA